MPDESRRNFLTGLIGLGFITAPGTAQKQFDFTRLRNHRDFTKARQHILTAMQLVMGPLPSRTKFPLDIRTLTREETPTFTRTKIQYRSEAEDFVAAHLLVPSA